MNVDEEQRVYPSTVEAEHSFDLRPFARPESLPTATRWQRFLAWFWQALAGR